MECQPLSKIACFGGNESVNKINMLVKNTWKADFWCCYWLISYKPCSYDQDLPYDVKVGIEKTPDL